MTAECMPFNKFPELSFVHSGRVDECTLWVLDSLAQVTFQQNEGPFVIADYGTGNIGSSTNLLQQCIQRLKQQYGRDQEIQVLYEDQQTNDFNALFMGLYGKVPGPPYSQFSGVYVSACATNFYWQCFPSNSVHFAFSSTAFHWLSKMPCNLKDSTSHMVSGDAKAQELFAEQAATDYETILCHRAKELAPGGRMVFMSIMIDEYGRYSGKYYQTKLTVSGTMSDVWKNMAAEGIITQEEFEDTAFNFYIRTEQEYTAPLNNMNSKPWKAGLRLVDFKKCFARCQLHKRWMEKEKTGDHKDARAHAEDMVKLFRPFSHFTHLSGLSEKRTEHDKERIVEIFFQRLEDLIAAIPAEMSADMVYACVHITKI